MVRKKGEKSDSNYSRQDIILQILIYLYNKQSGRLPTDIQLHCSNHTLAYDYVNDILNDLWTRRVIDREEVSERRITYRINEKSRRIVEVCKGDLKDVFFRSVDFDRL